MVDARLCWSSYASVWRRDQAPLASECKQVSGASRMASLDRLLERVLRDNRRPGGIERVQWPGVFR
jgi:hypothetical protein